MEFEIIIHKYENLQISIYYIDVNPIFIQEETKNYDKSISMGLL